MKRLSRTKENMIAIAIAGIVIFNSFLILGGVIGSYFNEIDAYLPLRPLEVCMLDKNKESISCFLNTCPDKSEKCSKKYSKKIFLKKIKKEGFFLGNKDLLLHHLSAVVTFCTFRKKSEKCIIKEAEYSKGFIKEINSYKFTKEKRKSELFFGGFLYDELCNIQGITK